MVNFQNGKIYKIQIGDEVYVGSTAKDRLCNRRTEHVKRSTLTDYQHYRLYDLINNLPGKWEGVHLELIEAYPCNSRDELRAREGVWIRQVGTLNKVVAGRTQKQHYQENKTQILLRQKEGYEKNKDKVLAQCRTYREENKTQIAERRKLYYEDNKPYINEKSKIKYENKRAYYCEKRRQYVEQNKEEVIRKKKIHASEPIPCKICETKITRGNMNTHVRRKHPEP